MSDQSLHDDMLKLIRYKILFLKRDYEHAFPDQEELIADNLDATNYTAWKIAAFIQHLSQRTTPVPAHWRQYPPNEPQYQVGGKLLGLPDEDKQYLRVQYNVLERRPRQPFRFAEEQVKVLAEMRDNLQGSLSLQAQVLQDLQTRVEQAQAESTRLHQQLTQAQATLATMLAERDRVQQELTQTQATLTTTQAERERLQQTLTTAQAEITRLQQVLTQTQATLTTTQAERERLQQALTAMQTERERLQQQLTQTQATLTTTQAERQRLQQELTQAQAALTAAQAENTRLQQQWDSTQDALTTAQAERERVQQQLASAQTERTQAQTALEQAQAELNTLRQEGVNKDARLQQLEQQVQLLEQGGLGAADAIYHLGASGGPGGGAFEDYIVPEYARLHTIRLRVTGQAIQAIQAVYVDAQGQTFFYMEQHGATAGQSTEHVFQLAADEYLTEVRGRAANVGGGIMVTNLTLITNKQSSPTYATAAGGNPFRYEAPSGYEIIGFHGRSGILLDQLGVQVRRSTRTAVAAPRAQALPWRAQEVVATLAGTPGDVGYRDGPASVARFNRPYKIALDDAGTLYVTDFSNHIIRKIAPTGEVMTLAGAPGESGHRDGPGGTARFNGPRGIAIDAAGILYVAEAGNHTIRTITPAGEVSTLAGTPGQSGNANGVGSAARFNTPDGMAIDTAGMLYVADSNNHTIRTVTPTGAVSTVAGAAGQSGHADGAGSAARFTRPVGVAVETAGTLSIAENGNHTIRKITPAGEVSTVAGAPGQSGHADGLGSAARFQEPNDVAVDTTGTLYVTETGNHTIRTITPAGEVTTLAGSPGQREARDGLGSSARFNLPSGIAVNAAGTLYVADQGNAVIRTLRLNHTARIVSTLAGRAGQAGHADGAGSAARFNHPYNMALDSAGILYLADEVNHVIRKITPPGAVTTLAGVPGQSGHRDGPGRDARFNRPRALVVDTAGTVYVTDAGNHVLRRVTPQGEVTTLSGAPGLSGHRDGPASAARFNTPDGIAVDARGMLYVADSNNHVIRTVTPAAEVTTPIGMAGVSGHRDGLCIAALLSRPQGLALGPTGTLYIVEEGNQVVRQVTAAGQVSTLAGVPGQSGHRDGPGSVARFQDPTGVAIDAAGMLYIAESGTHTIRLITPSGEVATLAGSAGARGSHDGPGGMARFQAPLGIAVNAAGIIYVADGDNHVLRQLTPRGVV